MPSVIAGAQHRALQLGRRRGLVDGLEHFEHLRRHLHDEGLALGGVAAGDAGAADLLRRVDEVPLQRQALRLGDLADALPVGPPHRADVEDHRGPGGKHGLGGGPDQRVAAAEALHHPGELDGTLDVGAEQARTPFVEDEGDRALAAGQGVGVGGLPRGAGPEDHVERGWQGVTSSLEAREQGGGSCSPLARATAQLDLRSPRASSTTGRRSAQGRKQAPGPRPRADIPHVRYQWDSTTSVSDAPPCSTAPHVGRPLHHRGRGRRAFGAGGAGPGHGAGLCGPRPGRGGCGERQRPRPQLPAHGAVLPPEPGAEGPVLARDGAGRA